jgi:hypothetical protein
MESSRININEIVIENEYCNIFPHEFFVEKVSMSKTMEENRSLQS